jgi:ethanolamine utilization protein EutQ
MPAPIAAPTKTEAVGNKPKTIRERVGRVNSSTSALSVAHVTSPAGGVEPAQTPEFGEYALVRSGMPRVEHQDGEIDNHAGQAILTTPASGFAVRLATVPMTSLFACRLSRNSVHRDS